MVGKEGGAVVITAGSHAYKILSLICISGEISADSIFMMNTSTPKYTGRIITMLRDLDLIKLHIGDGLRGYRATRKGKALLLSREPDRFSYALEEKAETNRVKSELRRRIRLQRIAEITVMMNNTGVKIYRDEKTKLFCPNERPVLDIHIGRPSFYLSREYKDIGGEMAKIKNARAAGLLITKAEAHLVYNTGDTRMKWNANSELRAKTVIRHYLNYEAKLRQFEGAEVNAMLMGKSMDLAHELMINANKNYFMLDGTFRHFYYFTLDSNGEVLIKIIINEKLKKSLDSSLLQGLSPPDYNRLYEHDGFSGETPVIINYLCDLPKLARFNTALSLQEHQGIIICFDFQEAFIKKYCGDHISIQTIKLDKFKRSALYEP